MSRFSEQSASIDEGLYVVGQRGLDEAGGALNGRRVDQIFRHELAARRTLSADGDVATYPYGFDQLCDRSGVRQLKIGLASGYGEPDCPAGEPDRHRGSRSDSHRGDSP